MECRVSVISERCQCLCTSDRLTLSNLDTGRFIVLPHFQSNPEFRLELVLSNVSAGTQTLLRQSTKIGQLVGLSLVGWSIDKFGQRPTQLVALAALVPIIAMQVFAPNVVVLVVAQTLVGLPLSTFLTLSNGMCRDIMTCKILDSLRPLK